MHEINNNNFIKTPRTLLRTLLETFLETLVMVFLTQELVVSMLFLGL